MHSFNLIIISYKRFESIWQVNVNRYICKKDKTSICWTCVVPSISSFAKTVYTRRYTLLIAVWPKSWNLYAVNKLLFVTTLFSDLLVINWYMYAVRYIRNDEALASGNSLQHLFVSDCFKLTITVWHLILYMLFISQPYRVEIQMCWTKQIVLVRWITHSGI